MRNSVYDWFMKVIEKSFFANYGKQGCILEIWYTFIKKSINRFSNLFFLWNSFWQAIYLVLQAVYPALLEL